MIARMAVLLALVAGCTFERRSPSLACTVPEDCMDGRTCLEGWCVEEDDPDAGDPADGPAVDADPETPDARIDASPPDAFVCPPECTSCMGSTCLITCETGLEPLCTGVVTCPPGYRCEVACTGADTCAMGIDCSQALSCLFDCTGAGSCDGMLTCGTGQCTLNCQNMSCNGGIECSDACQCRTTCGAGSCSPEPICPPGCDQPGDCKTNGSACMC